MLRLLLQNPSFTRVPKSFIRSQSNIALPFLYKLEPKCRSCGIKLQTDDASKPGYFIQPSGTTITGASSNEKKYTKNENQVFEKLSHTLPPEDQELLLSNTFNAGPAQQRENKQQDNVGTVTSSSLNNKGETVHEVLEKIYTVEPDENSHDCIRCRQMTYNSSYEMDSENYPIDQLHHVLHNIPIEAPLVYLFSASDFPMGINPDVFQFRKPQDVYFVMTKTDKLIEKSKEASQNYTRQFIQDYLHIQYKVPRSHVFISSGKNNWSVKQLYHFIPNGAYIIGNTNCGKSTLIKSLLLDEELQRKKDQQLNSKADNVKLPPSLINKMKQKFVSSFLTKIGPGISYLPGFTRDIIPVEVGLKLVYDVPGFNTHFEKMHQLYDSFKSPKDIHRLIKGASTFERGIYKSPYITIRGPQVVNFEGLGFLQLPKGGIYQLRNVTNLQTHVFSDILKTKKILQNGVPRALENKFAIDVSGKTIERDYEKFLVPPFYGTVDLVFENFGYLNLKPVGSKRTNELLKLYLYPGVNAILRDPITNYIAKTFSGKDKHGNVVDKSEYFKKSRFHLIRYKESHPICSQLCPLERKETSEVDEGVDVDMDVDVEQAIRKIRDEEYRRLNEWVREGRQETKRQNRSTMSGNDYGRGLESEYSYNNEYDMDERTKFNFWRE
ncbi:GEP3 [Candida theae]|uniref:Genetic interactor of prohibitins 3, mitochondrial n=1 Tax=Candida theae TaxID=1198502 RepID=A0AAD5BJY5_9ASCO|nr:GEP3 [Candida theae]KAI5968914.1 GEP3 [Candida theae]